MPQHRFGREGKMDKETVSIYTIAKEAGVSPATVSRVLTGSARVSEEKKQRVRELIEKYDFRPNATARGLSRVETKVIGFLVSDIRDPFYAEIVVACEKAAAELGYLLILCNSFGRKELELACLEKFYSQRVDAVIYMGGTVDELASDMEYVERVNQIANTTPLLIAGRLDGADCRRVCFDYGQSMELLMRYLLENGHRRIVLTGGNEGQKASFDRRLRYRQMLRKYGMEIPKDSILEAEGSVEAGVKVTEQLLNRGKPLPTAVVADNDFLAVGILRALQAHGLRIPQDISVVSFGDTYLARTCMPRLTCAGYDHDGFGRLLMGTAVRMIHGKETPAIQMMEARLVVRESGGRSGDGGI